MVLWIFSSSLAAAAGLFGSSEVEGKNITPFTKWTQMLKRHGWEEEREARPDARRLPCRLGDDLQCRADNWRNLLAALQRAADDVRIRDVNAFMNKAAYITDLRNYGIGDYWATVREFLDKDGDCEDFAIAKYFSLKALGFDPGRMRIVVVEDLNLKTPHAVLALYTDSGVLILDNQIALPVRADSIVHYKPLYSINESAWWLHRL
jgi:predicted transglutaminase-like cysteine proteinase